MTVLGQLEDPLLSCAFSSCSCSLKSLSILTLSLASIRFRFVHTRVLVLETEGLQLSLPLSASKSTRACSILNLSLSSLTQCFSSLRPWYYAIISSCSLRVFLSFCFLRNLIEAPRSSLGILSFFHNFYFLCTYILTYKHMGIPISSS